jgi:glucose/arabinose dehydrogenase
MNRTHRVTLGLFGVALFLCLGTSSPSSAQRIEYETRDVATNLNSPWEIRWGKDNWIWFTERAGRLDRVDPETGELKVLLRESDVQFLSTETGMLGFDFHPDFPDSPYVFIIYTYRDNVNFPNAERYFEKVVRYTYSSDTLAEPRTIFGGVRDGLNASEQHNGSRIAIGPDKKLYVSTGDIGRNNFPQQDTSPNGKILRLNLDGSIPEDNPWKGSPVWSKGHRNAQGLVFGPEGILFESEHGPNNDDEFNIIEKGRNYGWPNVDGFCDQASEAAFCRDSNVAEPVVAWTPTIAPSGTEYYNSDRIPEWKNSILIMTLKDESVWQIPLDATHRKSTGLQRYHLALKRLRDICISTNGRVFVSTSNATDNVGNPDRIFEIIRTGPSGVKEQENKWDTKISPNPAQGRITISGLQENKITFFLSDALGRAIRTGFIDRTNNTISVEHLTPGLYCISMLIENHAHTLRAIVQ